MAAKCSHTCLVLSVEQLSEITSSTSESKLLQDTILLIVFSRIFAHYVNFAEHNEPYAYLETDFIKIAEFNPDEYYRYDEGQMKEYFPESWEKYIKGEFPLAQPSPEAVQAYKDEQAANGG